jgi:hypothetical protein
MWSHGYLAGMGLAPELQSEPQRLQEQIRPDGLVLQQPEAAQARTMNLQRLRSPKRLRWTSAPPAAPESKSDGKSDAATVAARAKDAKDTKDAKTAIKEPEAAIRPTASKRRRPTAFAVRWRASPRAIGSWWPAIRAGAGWSIWASSQTPNSWTASAASCV